MTDEARRRVEALRMCPVASYRCEDCPVYVSGESCQNELEAANLIEKLSDELDGVTAERDAAREDLRIAAINGMNLCEVCKYAGRACEQRRHVVGVCWEWRGVDKEEIACEDEFFWETRSLEK